MNFLEMLADLFKRSNRNHTADPAWRGHPYKADRRKIPRGHGKRTRDAGPLRMQIERYEDKAVRDDRYRELREAGVRDVSKFSTYDGSKSVWCVVRP